MLGIIDDPFRNWADAQSSTFRRKTWEWYRTTFRTRIWEHGAIILVMTRWHPDDLAGRILDDQSEDWEVLRLPAIAETREENEASSKILGIAPGPDPLGRKPGAPLCPGRFSLEALDRLKRDVGSVGWAAEYQGVPRALEGNRLKREFFQVEDISPKNGQRVRYWDKAGTAGGGAYTAGGLMLRDSSGRFHIEDMVRGQWSALERERVILQTAQLDATNYGDFGGVTTWIEQEPGSGGKESAEATVRNLAGFAIRVERVTGSKEVRAEPFLAQCEAQNVWLVRGRWNQDFLDEALMWPNGKRKDQIDSAGGALNKLAAYGGSAATWRPVATKSVLARAVADGSSSVMRAEW